jgi:hypothetical protein
VYLSSGSYAFYNLALALAISQHGLHRAMSHGAGERELEKFDADAADGGHRDDVNNAPRQDVGMVYVLPGVAYCIFI